MSRTKLFDPALSSVTDSPARIEEIENGSDDVSRDAS